jgi:adenylate kinase
MFARLARPLMTTASASRGLNTYLILGPPGGGKGTISSKILNSFPSFTHLSTGDMLRKHVKDETEIGKKAAAIMKEGGLIGDDIMIDLVLSSVPKDATNLLLDGFPRTQPQAVALDSALKVDFVLALDVPDEVIVSRVCDRWIGPSSGEVYSYSYNPPKVEGKCDKTGEDLIQREDDKPESVLKRLATYASTTQPIIEYFEGRGQVFSGETSDVIFGKVEKVLKERNC